MQYNRLHTPLKRYSRAASQYRVGPGLEKIYEGKVMKGTKTFSVALLSGMLLWTFASQAIAQAASEQLPEGLALDQPGPKSAAQQRIEKEILGFQAEIKAAATAKDRSKLEALFSPDASITLAQGVITDKAGRVGQIMGPGLAFERMDYANQTIRLLGDAGAVAFVNSTIFTRPTPDQPKGIVRAMIVYRKGKASEGYHGWQLASALGMFIPAKSSGTP
jgi:hypothetical protein